jgi:uncharacterized protein YndB with AHSA1/START domain
MHRTGMFRRCSATSDSPVGKGTTYDNATRMGTFEGEVTEFDPPHRIAFSETLSWFGHPMTRARPEYFLEQARNGTVVHHVAIGELYGWMRFTEARRRDGEARADQDTQLAEALLRRQ